MQFWHWHSGAVPLEYERDRDVSALLLVMLTLITWLECVILGFPTESYYLSYCCQYPGWWKILRHHANPLSPQTFSH